MGTYKVKRTKGYTWAYDFRHQGTRYKKEGFLTRSEASIAEGEKRRILQAKPLPFTPCISLVQLAERYLFECQTVKGLASNTIRQKHFVYSSFIHFLNRDMPVDSVTRKLVKEYLTVRARLSGNCAANRDKKEIKALFNWAVEEDFLFMRNPCKGIRNFPEDDFQKYIPPKKDILEVKLKATGDERDFITCTYGLLGRRKEIKKIRWIDVNFQTRWVDLFTRKKGGGLRRMPKPMNEDVQDVLERRFRKKGKNQYVFQFTRKDLDRMLPRLCKKAGVPVFGFHALRHHAATSLLENGRSIKEIQFLLGHERASTTEGYLHLQSGDFHKVVRALDEKSTRSHTLNEGDV